MLAVIEPLIEVVELQLVWVLFQAMEKFLYLQFLLLPNMTIFQLLLIRFESMANFQRGHDARYTIEMEAGVHHQATKSQKEEKLAMS